MKILLINPPDDLKSFLGRGRSFVPVFEPLGLLYIAAVCKHHGYETIVMDASAERLSLEDVQSKIEKIKPQVIGMTSFVSNGGVVYDLGRWIKREHSEITVILGNTHAAVYAEAYLNNRCCDIVVHGEGEYVFLEILRALEKEKEGLADIEEISFGHNGTFRAHQKVAFIEDLSLLPLPDRDAVTQYLYNIPSVTNAPYTQKKQSLGKHMFTSRGCLFSCRFCTVHNKCGQRINAVSKVIDEMELLEKRYGADYLFISDPIFTSQKERVISICREKRKRGLRFLWGCEGHVNLIDREMAEEMEAAGCYDIAFGIESGVQHILDAVRKGIRLERIRETIEMVKCHTGIKVSGLFILGLPGEQYRDSRQTIAFAKSLPLDMAQFSILSPYPGSPIFYELKNSGMLDTGIREDGSIDTAVWLRYSAYISYTPHEPIWVTPGLTAQQLKGLQKRAFREFYFRPRQFIFQLKRVRLAELGRLLFMFKDTFF